MALDSKAAVGLVTGLFVAALMGAFLMPVAIGEIADPAEETITQDVNETVELKNDLDITLDATTDATDATYTVNASGTTASTTVNVGANDTVTVDGADVTIAVSEATATNATATVSYPTTYGWDSGAVALWGILPVIIVLALFLYFTFIALRRL